MSQTLEQEIERLKLKREELEKQERHDRFVFNFVAWDQTKRMEVDAETGVILFRNEHPARRNITRFVVVTEDFVERFERLEALVAELLDGSPVKGKPVEPLQPSVNKGGRPKGYSPKQAALAAKE